MPAQKLCLFTFLTVTVIFTFSPAKAESVTRDVCEQAIKGTLTITPEQDAECMDLMRADKILRIDREGQAYKLPNYDRLVMHAISQLVSETRCAEANAAFDDMVLTCKSVLPSWFLRYVGTGGELLAQLFDNRGTPPRADDLKATVAFEKLTRQAFMNETFFNASQASDKTGATTM